jgi:glycosyltransferase involved in cell wall biosynthesis
MVYSPRWGSRYTTILFKYLSQSFKTYRLLRRERPDAVFVMTPPVFACVPVWIYSRLNGIGYFIDAHSGAFLDPRWTGTLFLHKFFSRSALATLVTNPHLRELVSSWNARVVVVPDVPLVFPATEAVRAESRTSMLFVATFAIDEPVREFFLAAAQVPDVQFFVTGNHRKCPAEVLKLKPDNVTLMGFVTREEYVRRLKSADAVIALTTLDHTMQRAAYEAVYAGKPVVTSNFELLRREFPRGTVHVDVTVESIRDGIRRMQGDVRRYTREAQELREHKLRRWDDVRGRLLRLMQPG